MKAIILSLAVLLIANSANLYCSADAEEVETVKETFSVPASTGHAFLETFQDDPFSRWTESSDSSYDGQKWAHEARKETSDFYATDMVSIDANLLSYPYFSFVRLSSSTSLGERVDTHTHTHMGHSIVLNLMVTLFMVYK